MKNLCYLLLAIIVFATACRSTKNTTEKAPVQKPKTGTTLTNTYWKLTEADGNPIVTPTDAKEAHIRLLDKDHGLQGFGGCNSLMGSYATGKDNKISFNAGSTKMYCSNMENETRMMSALTQANRYKINGDHLLLYNDNLLLAIFEATYFE